MESQDVMDPQSHNLARECPPYVLSPKDLVCDGNHLVVSSLVSSPTHYGGFPHFFHEQVSERGLLRSSEMD